VTNDEVWLYSSTGRDLTDFSITHVIAWRPVGVVLAFGGTRDFVKASFPRGLGWIHAAYLDKAHSDTR
jgi:hypothetical protein